MTLRDVLVAAGLPNKTVFRRGFYVDAARTDGEAADAALTALGANGYVVVPRHLLDERAEQRAADIAKIEALRVTDLVSSDAYGHGWNDALTALLAALDAPVEAVGPTREDQQ
jgi:hypothetical protein